MNGMSSGRAWRWTKRFVGFVAVIVVLALAPIFWVETSCFSERKTGGESTSRLQSQFNRPEINSYLTYPEWSIVHAYEDLAAIMRQTSASDFPYWSRSGSYWSSLCNIVGYASEKGTVSGEYRTMLYIIGVSFSAEMMVKGLYEQTIGRLTAWLRGEEKTEEDRFALKVADEYAAFLRQTPWYEFPFGARLSELWSEVPFGSSNWLRAIERRMALTFEYGGKAIYAKGIGALAAAAPADLRIRSVVTGGDPSAIGGVRIIEALDDGQAAIIETPRYAEFTRIIRDLASAGLSFSEIAGNDDIMVAVLAPVEEPVRFPLAKTLFSAPVAARPGWQRNMMNVPVSSLTEMIRALDAGRAELEHVYDY
ncbi:MAG: hypothetical protein ACFCUR_20990 [Rhodomicrobiaceae bacterium]